MLSNKPGLSMYKLSACALAHLKVTLSLGVMFFRHEAGYRVAPRQCRMNRPQQPTEPRPGPWSLICTRRPRWYLSCLPPWESLWAFRLNAARVIKSRSMTRAGRTVSCFVYVQAITERSTITAHLGCVSNAASLNPLARSSSAIATITVVSIVSN